MANTDAAAYRTVKLGKPDPRGEWVPPTAGRWDLVCCACGAVLGTLSIPFSGDFVLPGSNAHLDPRLVERSGPETRTGHRYRRYGPPSRMFAKGKGPRSAVEARPGLIVHGPFWVYCHACNTGQAVEPEPLTR